MSITVERMHRLVVDERELGVFSDAQLLAILTTCKALLRADRYSQPSLSLLQFIAIFASESGRSADELKGARGLEQLCFLRQIGMSLAWELIPESSSTSVGAAFGGRDHGTVIHARKCVLDRIQTDFKAKALYQSLRARVIKRLSVASLSATPEGASVKSKVPSVKSVVIARVETP